MSLNGKDLIYNHTRVHREDVDDEIIHLKDSKSIKYSLGNDKKEDNNDDTLTKKFCSTLIVDDVPMNRKMLKRLLMNRVDECDEAEDGQQAVDMVREAMGRGKHYDIITMDYQMPVMDGVRATNNIRKLGFKGQIIGVTGNAFQEDVVSFMTNGANVVLTKPLSIATFDDYLNSLQ